MRRSLPFLLLIGLLVATPAAAQVGVTTDIITGTVTDGNGTPIPGATVEVMSLETRVLRSAVTDPRGWYRVLFPDGGNPGGTTAANRNESTVGSELIKIFAVRMFSPGGNWR